jgi:hypothetical protein
MSHGRSGHARMPFSDSEMSVESFLLVGAGWVALKGQNAPVDSPESLRGHPDARRCWVGCGVRRRLAPGTPVDWTWVSSEGSSGALGSSCSGRYRLREVAPRRSRAATPLSPLSPLSPIGLGGDTAKTPALTIVSRRGRVVPCSMLDHWPHAAREVLSELASCGAGALWRIRAH